MAEKTPPSAHRVHQVHLSGQQQRLGGVGGQAMLTLELDLHQYSSSLPPFLTWSTAGTGT